ACPGHLDSRGTLLPKESRSPGLGATRRPGDDGEKQVPAFRNTLPVAIAGGGIGGLACALALARHGFRSLVLEQARQFGEVGVGLHVAPNALTVLDRLGVGAAAKKNALMIERLL